MDTKIKDAFWKDPAIEQLVEAGDRDAILSLLWLLTAEVNHAGWVEVTPRRFLFQTSCSFEALQRACQALGKGIVSHPKGFWIRNFIRHQIGSGEDLAGNNMAGAVLKSFQMTPPEIVAEVMIQYPELKDSKSYAKAKKLTETLSPSQGLAKGCQSTREEKSGEEKSGEEGNGSAEGKGPITLAAAHAYAKRYCANSPTALIYDADQVELWFADRERKQWQATSGQIIGTLALAQSDLEFWLRKHKTGQTHPRPGSGERGKTSPLEKKGAGGAAAHPLAVPPCADWKKLARIVCERAEVTDFTWLDEANWTDLASDDRQAVIDEWKRTNAGGAS